MSGQARFIYTDADMIAAQRAGWTWFVRLRNLAIAYVAIVLFNVALLAALNAAYGTRPVASDPLFVIGGAAAETILLAGLMFWLANIQGRQVLRSRKRGMPWNGDDLGGDHIWAWDERAFHVTHERGRADLAWSSVGAWLDAPNVLLLFPPGGRAFSIPEHAKDAGWREAPKVFLYPSGGHAIALPKRALVVGDTGRLLDVLRTAGVRERRRFGLIAAKNGGSP